MIQYKEMVTLLRYSIYHSVLRISVLVFAILLVFDSGLVSPQSNVLSISTQQYLANTISSQVGTVSVKNDEHIAIITKTDEMVSGKGNFTTISLSEDIPQVMNKSTLILSSIVFTLLLLILINYVVDCIRTRKMIVLKTSPN